MSKDKEILEASLRAFAVADRLDDIKNLLLAHPEVDVNAVDGNGNSALMLVASEKRDTSVAIAHFLMENGASTELKNNDGKDATDRAMDVYPNNEMFLKLQEPIKVIDRSVKRVLGERNFQSGKIPIRNRSLSDKSMDSDVTDRESVSTEGDEVSNVLNQLQRMTVEQLAQLREALPKEILAALSGEEAIEEKKKINRPNGPKKTHKALNLGGQHGSVQQVRVEEGRVAKPLEIDELQPQIKGNEVSSVLLPLSAEDREISDNITLTEKQLFLALSEKIPYKGQMVDNFYTKWNEIDSSLPKQEILIYGPSSTSGTRDIINDLLIKNFGGTAIRHDKHYIEMPEDNNLTIQKILHNKYALGIIGLNFLEQNYKIKAININGVSPNNQNIISGNYPLFRPLFVYVNYSNIDYTKGINEFIIELTNDNAIGENGYLTQKGLTKMVEKAKLISQ